MSKTVKALVVAGALLALGAGCAKQAAKTPAAPATEPETSVAAPAEETGAGTAVDRSAWKTATAENPVEPCPAQFTVVPESSALNNSLPVDKWVGPLSQAAAAYNEDGELLVKVANYALGATKDDMMWNPANDVGEVTAMVILQTKSGGAFTTGFYANAAEGSSASLLALEPSVAYKYDTGSGGVGFMEAENSGVKITKLTADQVCGVMQVNDGYASVTGAFSAPILK